MIHLRRGSIGFTAGDGHLSRAIRWRTKSAVNHVFVVTTDGPLHSVKVVEALHPRVVEHELISRYLGRTDRIWIFDPINATDIDRNIIVSKARSYVGRRYGWTKIITQAIPGLSSLAFIDGWPICSWVGAAAYWDAGLTFGVDVDDATPAHLYDFSVRRPDKMVAKVEGLTLRQALGRAQQVQDQALPHVVE